MVSTENASLLPGRDSAERLRFCKLSQFVQRGEQVGRDGERALVVRPERADPRGERRPQERRRLRALSEA